MSHKDIRDSFTWGRNFDSDMNRLPEREIIKLKDMGTEHIQAILDGGFANYHTSWVFVSELAWREALNIE